MRQPFERVVADHGATILRVCRAVVGPDEAEDAWSEALLAALRAYPALPEDANVEAWLVTIAHRKAIDLLRARARRPVPVAEPAPASTRQAPARDDHTELAAAVRGLPERQRLAVTYHYIADLPYAEVARIIGGTPAAARRAAADGIRGLRADRSITDGERS